MAEDAARELPNLPLEDLLQLVHLYAERGSPKFEMTALRWLERCLTEGALRLQHFAEITASLAKLWFDATEGPIGGPTGPSANELGEPSRLASTRGHEGGRRARGGIQLLRDSGLFKPNLDGTLDDPRKPESRLLGCYTRRVAQNPRLGLLPLHRYAEKESPKYERAALPEREPKRPTAAAAQEVGGEHERVGVVRRDLVAEVSGDRLARGHVPDDV
jgi:hypothetical protein